MVAERSALQDPAGEPTGARCQQRHASRSGTPLTRGELVHLVAGFGAEQSGEIPLLRLQQMDRQPLRMPGDPIGVILDRQADQQSDRVDAALGEEAGQASAGFGGLCMRRGHDDDRVVGSGQHGVDLRADVTLGRSTPQNLANTDSLSGDAVRPQSESQINSAADEFDVESPCWLPLKTPDGLRDETGETVHDHHILFHFSPPCTHENETRNGPGDASLVRGMAGFMPFPDVLASVLAIGLGWISGTQNADGNRSRNAAGTTGLMLGIVGVALFATFCFAYFVVLGYPLPAIHRYQPRDESGCRDEDP